MNYNYCDENILQSPQKYMYTKFGGVEFLKSYYQQRLKIINKIYSYTQGDNESNIKLHDDLISGVVNYISTEKIKFYNKKQFYGYHIDSFIKPYKDCQNKNWEGKYRKLSLTLQLSDPSEYEGGDFYFKYLTSEGVKEEKVDDAKELGTIIIFPSFVYHQVTPITKGTRKSLVNWSLGFPFK